MIPMTHELQTTSSITVRKVPVEIHLLSGHKKAAKFGANFCMCGKRTRPGLSAGFQEGFLADFRLFEDFDTLGMCVFEKRSGDIHIYF